MTEEKLKPTTREELFIRLYKQAFPATAGFVQKMGGSFEEARDVFQDALVIYFEKHTATGFSPRYNEKAYITGIARHLWYRNYRQGKNTITYDPQLEADLTAAEDANVSGKLLHYVELSGKKCLALLKSFYYDNLNMKEIAMRFGFSGERSATAQKYKCLEKVRNSIREKAMSREDFYE